MIFFFSYFLLVPFFATIQPVAGNATWHFSGNLSCPLDTFTYRIQVYEEDLIESSDDLLTNSTEIVSTRPHKYQVDAADDHDGFDLFGQFEIYLVFIHNCNQKGNWKRFRHDCGTYDINVGEVTQVQDFKLYEQGEYYDGR